MLRKGLNVVLPMDLGDFHSVEVVSMDKMAKKGRYYTETQEGLEKVKALKELYEDGKVGSDEINLAAYEYKDGGIASLRINFNFNLSLYTIVSEWDGNVDIEEAFLVGKEKQLLHTFAVIAHKKTSEWATRESELAVC